MSKSICTPKLNEISQFTAEILLLPIFENKGPPYLNSTFGLGFDLFIVTDMTFRFDATNFIQIGQCTVKL